MKIKNAIFSQGNSAFFFDDQRAIKGGAKQDGFVYVGDPVTKGFTQIREPGQSISVMLVLDDGQVALGDCAAVQYSGAGGRDPLFLASEYVPFLEKHIKPLLEGMELKDFRSMAKHFAELQIEGKSLHTAIRYGLTQALLDARAKELHLLPCEVVCNEYSLPVIAQRIPVFGQTGDNRYENADKMIIKEVDALPHGLINNINDKLGQNGEKLKDYIEWLANRIKKMRASDSYCPSIHIDVYGTIGKLYEYDMDKVVDYLASLESHAGGFPLYIEGPMDMEEKNLQIEKLAYVTQKLNKIGSNVKIVADEWCNTFEDIKEFVDAKACHMVQIKTPDLGGVQNIVESILYCKNNNVEAYQGGTCNETDVSAKICVHIAMAARADRMLVKPGMGFDEGFTIVNNEMERIIALLRFKNMG